MEMHSLSDRHVSPFQWMVRRWTKYIGQEETIRLMTWNNSDPSFSLRFLAMILCSPPLPGDVKQIS